MQIAIPRSIQAVFPPKTAPVLEFQYSALVQEQRYRNARKARIRSISASSSRLKIVASAPDGFLVA